MLATIEMTLNLQLNLLAIRSSRSRCRTIGLWPGSESVGEYFGLSLIKILNELRARRHNKLKRGHHQEGHQVVQEEINQEIVDSWHLAARLPQPRLLARHKISRANQKPIIRNVMNHYHAYLGFTCFVYDSRCEDWYFRNSISAFLLVSLERFFSLMLFSTASFLFSRNCFFAISISVPSGPAPLAGRSAP